MQSPFELRSNGSFDLSHGFLPKKDPLHVLPKQFDAWENLAHSLPKLIEKPCLRSEIEQLEPFDLNAITNGEERERAMVVLSYLAHGYVWTEGQPPATRLPANLAQPWYLLAKELGRPPILSYASYASYNWYRINSSKPVALGNIALLNNFAGGLDEEWFIMVHVEIEQLAVPGLQAVGHFAEVIQQHDSSRLQALLEQLRDCLEAMNQTMDRMLEFCDPHAYYIRVRPYIHGWKGNPALPQGLIYEGVEAYAGKPQQFKGETGAQSTIIPCFDAALGVVHGESPLKAHLDEMRIYMPPQHLAYLEHLESQATARDYIVEHEKNNTALKEVFNECVNLIDRFRLTHLKYAASYIQKQAQTTAANSTEVGTGGTPFMKYLSLHQQETEAHLL